MRRLIRRAVLWALPELAATVEREQWISAFWQAAAAQQYTQAAPADVERRVEVN